MDGHLRTLGARCLRSVVLGDDASDLELQFERWKIEVSMILSSHLAAADESYEESVLSKSTAPVAPFILTEKDFEGLSRKERMELKKVTRELKALHYQELNAKMSVRSQADSTATSAVGANSGGCCQSQDKGDHKHEGGCCKTEDANSHAPNGNSASGGCCSAPANGADNDDDDGTVELEEEDLINDQFVTYDQIDSDEDEEDEDDDEGKDDNKEGAARVDGNIGGCGEGDEHQIDLEDLGRALSNSKTSATRNAIKTQLVNSQGATTSNENLKEMATKLQRKALSKEGYKLIGSHSAVKLCRWTKHQLRGRGGCYKHTFYGINSYQCMEATPSLACANKCVFCWRHHRNPVGTEWRWKMDDPAYIVEEGVKLHQNMINEFKGAAGVIPERLKEAFNVRHCALSLVGEPIMYPRINEMLKELHIRKISSFLVTNAQFPERIQQLDPVTQLYVSVDASSRDSLKAIDRPLFKDFWERFIGCLKELRHKQQRTVYRMTLVKDWNMNAVDEYVELIEMGQPGKTFFFTCYETCSVYLLKHYIFDEFL